MTENTKNPSDLDKGNENQTGDNDAISSMHVFVAEAIRLTRQKSDLAAAALFLSYFLNTTDESILIQYGLDPDALRIVGNRFRENEVWCEEYEEPVLFSFVEDELTSIIDVGRGILILDRFFIPVDSNDSYVFTSVESAEKYYAREFFSNLPADLANRLMMLKGNVELNYRPRVPHRKLSSRYEQLDYALAACVMPSNAASKKGSLVG